MTPPPGPMLTLHDRQVSERPQGLARRLARASVGMLLVSCVASLLLSLVYPESTAMPHGLSVLMGLGYFSTLGLTGLAALAQLWCWVTPRRRATVEADGQALSVLRQRRRRVPVGDIAAGWLLRVADRGEVELALRNGDVLAVEVRDRQEADALLDAVNVAPRERALTMRLGGPLMDLTIGAAAFLPGGCAASLVAVSVERMLHLPSVATGFLLFTLTALAIAFSVTTLRPPEVRVGHDGVSTRGGRGAWFAPWTEITQITRHGNTLTFSLRSGDARVLSLAGTPAARRDALCARIAEAHAEALAPRDLSARLVALDRQGRDLDAWREALRAIPTARDDYRQTGLSRDELVAALSDPHAPEERRIAAAFVLSSMDPDTAAARVRIAVETLAHDPAREALRRAAEGTLDEDALRHAAGGRVRLQ